jgi:hypothetical protein
MVVINDDHHHNPIRSSYQCLFMIIIDNPALIMIALMITTKKTLRFSCRATISSTAPTLCPGSYLVAYRSAWTRFTRKVSKHYGEIPQEMDIYVGKYIWFPIQMKRNWYSHTLLRRTHLAMGFMFVLVCAVEINYKRIYDIDVYIMCVRIHQCSLQTCPP